VSHDGHINRFDSSIWDGIACILEFGYETGAHLFLRRRDLPQQKESSINSPTKRIPPTMPSASATLLFFFCEVAADVCVLAADATAEGVRKGVEEVVDTANKSGL
jgi:hypothetical protein